MDVKFVECRSHGESRPAFLCVHLLAEFNVGWNEPEEYDKEEDDDFFGCINAWCDQCEKKAIETGGWNEESEAFADIRLACEHCALRIKSRNLP